MKIKRQGNVTYKDKYIGTLSEINNGGTVFEYSNEWNNIPVACRLDKKTAFS